jgi:hypothetical protein
VSRFNCQRPPVFAKRFSVAARAQQLPFPPALYEVCALVAFNRDAGPVFQLLNIGRKLDSDSVLSVRLNPRSLRFTYGR